MNRQALLDMLTAVADGKLDAPAAAKRLQSSLSDEVLDASVLDRHRALRHGCPEVILGERKTVSQIQEIVQVQLKEEHPVLVTRVDAAKAAELVQTLGLTYYAEGRCLTGNEDKAPDRGNRRVAIVTAGTSDAFVADEAAVTCKMLGFSATRFSDVGVAGLHRTLHRMDDIASHDVVIVAAGMEGALPSVIGGLIDRPIIAVPTSVGYGVGAGGFAALAGMLSSCASGVTVVNIDNGFGAAYAALRIVNAIEAVAP